MGNVFKPSKNQVPSPEVDGGAEISSKDDQTTYEFIVARPDIITGRETSGTLVERRMLPPRAAKDKSVFGNRGRSDRNDLQFKEVHAWRAKRVASCDSALDKHKASVSKRGQEIKTSREASPKGERRMLPPRAAKDKSVYGNKGPL